MSLRMNLDRARSVAHGLAVESLRSRGKLRLRAAGTSMLPAIWPGDTLLVRRCDPLAAREGDVVLYVREQGLVAHRLVARRGALLTTRGDALDGDDPAVPAADFLGKVARVVRAGKGRRPSPHAGLPARAAASLMKRSPLVRRTYERVRAALRRWL